MRPESTTMRAHPLAAEYVTVCWTSLLIQHPIEREFGVLYNRHAEVSGPPNPEEEGV